MNLRNNTTSTVLIVLMVATAVVANEKIVDYRHDSMEAIEIHFKSIQKILDEDIPFKGHLSMHVNALVDYGQMMPDLFVEGSEGGEALDTIWESDDLGAFPQAVKVYMVAILNLKIVLTRTIVMQTLMRFVR